MLDLAVGLGVVDFIQEWNYVLSCKIVLGTLHLETANAHRAEWTASDLTLPHRYKLLFLSRNVSRIFLHYH